jgi:hypothetical protein
MKPKSPVVGFLSYALVSLDEKKTEIRGLKLLTATQRLAVFLLDQIEDSKLESARFPLPYEKRYLAAKIGCSKEYLSRSFAALRSVGVSTEGSVVVALDIPALRAYAELSQTTTADT